MTRRGRPAGTDSAETRTRIIDAARQHFASSGYAAAAITAIASDADLAPSAAYHYFDGKADLYEAVFHATAGAVWGDIAEEVSAAESMIEAVDTLFSTMAKMGTRYPGYSDFLMLVPMECSMHPEFAHLRELRAKYQDGTFGAIADLGIRTGEFAGLDRDLAIEIVRAPIMGSSFEQRFRGSAIPASSDAVMALLGAMADRPS